MLILLLEEVLFSPQMIVQNGLLLQIVYHFGTNAVRFVDTISDSLVASSELVQGLDLLLEIIVVENKLVLCGVCEQCLMLSLCLCDDLFKFIHAENFFECSHTLKIVGVAFRLNEKEE